jgi:hypothetical protein
VLTFNFPSNFGGGRSVSRGRGMFDSGMEKILYFPQVTLSTLLLHGSTASLLLASEPGYLITLVI